MYLSKKVKMVLCVVLLMISIALAIGAIFWANNLDHNAYDYGELAYREFTVQSIKKSTGRNARYEIYTNEEQAPLIIGNISFAAVNRESMNLLKQGDKIMCYVTTASKKEFSYKIAELKTEHQTILSLEDYNTREINNQKVGCNLIGAFSIAFFCLSVWSIRTVIMDKKRGNSR